MHFAYYQALFLLVLVPFLIIFSIIVFDKKKKARESFARFPLFQRLTPFLSPRRQKVKAFLLVLCSIFLIFSLSGPQWGEKEREVKSKGIDVFLALDCSLSMSADDFKPSRLALAKSLLKKLSDNLQGNRIGVIAFAGAAYVECPLTTDVSAVKMYIDDLDQTSIPVQGTSLGDTIKTALENFPGKEKRTKVLVMLTDGEDLEGNVRKQIPPAQRENLKIYTLGIGTPEGTEIPQKDEKEKSVGPKMDREGKVVISKLDERTLKEIASATGGEYLRCSYDERGVNGISNGILHLEKGDIQGLLQKKYLERYQIPLSLALVLLIAEFLIAEKRGRRAGE
jgi:Ca-activated chloride channel homolog